MPLIRRRRIRRSYKIKRRLRNAGSKVRLLRGLSKYTRNVHNFKRSFILVSGISTNVNTGYLGLGYKFNLSQLPSPSEFSSLFDLYRINGIKIRIIHRATNLSSIEVQNSAQHVGLPYMYAVIDKDDDTAPPNIVQIQEYGKAKMFIFDTGKRVYQKYWRPNTLTVNTDAVAGSGYNNSVQYKQWQDCSSLNTNYYGFKAGIQMPGPEGAGTVAAYFDIEVTYYFQCMNTR